MSDKTIKTVRTATGIVLSVVAVICAVALSVACVQIYRSGDRPFTPESIAAAWSSTAIFVWILVLCTVVSGLLHLLLPLPDKKQKGIVSPQKRLAKAEARLARKQYSQAILAPIKKHHAYVKFMHRSAAVICVLSAVYPLIYLHNQDNFTSIDAMLNTQIIHAVIPSLCFAAAALGFCYAVRLLSDISCERAVLYAKAIMLLPAPAAEPKPIGKQAKGLPSYAILVVRIAVIAVAVLMIVFGIFNGGMHDVLQKAIKICTECIGLG